MVLLHVTEQGWPSRGAYRDKTHSIGAVQASLTFTCSHVQGLPATGLVPAQTHLCRYQCQTGAAHSFIDDPGVGRGGDVATLSFSCTEQSADCSCLLAGLQFALLAVISVSFYVMSVKQLDPFYRCCNRQGNLLDSYVCTLLGNARCMSMLLPFCCNAHTDQ